MKNIRLLGKEIDVKNSPLLLSCKQMENWQQHWQVMKGDWKLDGDWLIGAERGNFGGILFSREYFKEDVMLIFTAATILPATRDVNAVFCAEWDKNTDYLGNAYICGLNGWYDGKSGIERETEGGFRALTNCYNYVPGSEVRMCVGSISGHTFMVVDGVLVMEYIDPRPLIGGHVGFSPYSTMLKIKDIEVRKISWKPKIQTYEPEF